MPQSLLTGQLKEKLTYRVWCHNTSFVHATNGRLDQLSGRVEGLAQITTSGFERVSEAFSQVITLSGLTELGKKCYLLPVAIVRYSLPLFVSNGHILESIM
jgi:hypothetical protein